MTSQQILQSDLLDILFEKRNKLYGAYLLRKNYPIELAKAIGLTVLLVSILMLFGGSSSTQSVIHIPKDSISLTQVVFPDEIKPEPPKTKLPPAAQQVKTEVFTTDMKIVNQTVDPLATQAELREAVIGDVKMDGPVSSGPLPPEIPGANNGGTTAGEPEEKKEKAILPSRQPQFPGGAQAWLQFLGKNLHPPMDLDAGEKRSCLIRFSVDEEGTITNFQVLQSGGTEFDNEVIRVLKKMPKWLPAIQNGKPVAVSFTQPVTFAAAEE
jgi:periplasmic protein TonB